MFSTGTFEKQEIPIDVTEAGIVKLIILHPLKADSPIVMIVSSITTSRS